MPKPRAADRRQQEFVVQAWNSVTKEDVPVGSASQPSHAEIEFADLIQPCIPPSPVPTATFTAAATAGFQQTGIHSRDSFPAATASIVSLPTASPPSIYDTPWVQTSIGKKRPLETLSKLPTAPVPRDPFLDDLIPSEHAGNSSHNPPSPPPTSAHPTLEPSNPAANPDASADVDSEPTEGAGYTRCTGVCQLVLLPDGSISGHFIDSASHSCYGIMGTPVDSEDASSTCEYEEGEQVLRLTVINFDSLDEVVAVVARRGGDLVRLQPAEPWQLRSYLNLTKQEELEEAVAIQAHFHALLLLDGSAADLHMKNNGMSKMVGKGGVLNTGTFSLEGLPRGFK